MVNFTRSFNDGVDDMREIGTLSQKSGEMSIKWNKSWFGFGRYVKRYLVVKDHAIFVYKNQKKQVTEAVIDFNSITAAILISNHRPWTTFKLKILGLPSTINFKIPYSQTHTNELKDWLQTIHEHLEWSLGYLTDKATLTLTNPLTFKYPLLPNTDLLKYANTGDIILFRGYSKGSSLQRLFTCSKYDHVGVVLKTFDDSILLFESTSDLGVSFIDWNLFYQIGWVSKYDRVVYRKLKMNRTDEIVEKLESFISSVKDKKFKFSLKSVFGKGGGQNENQTFFWSELIAAVYQVLGILPEDEVCSRYWPGSFSTEKNIRLINGASLGEEYLITPY